MILPKATSIAALYNPANPANQAFLKDLRQRAGALGRSFLMRMSSTFQPRADCSQPRDNAGSAVQNAPGNAFSTRGYHAQTPYGLIR
jgi:hypothetical protein